MKPIKPKAMKMAKTKLAMMKEMASMPRKAKRKMRVKHVADMKMKKALLADV